MTRDVALLLHDYLGWCKVCFSVVQRVAVWCIVLQYVAVCCCVCMTHDAALLLHDCLGCRKVCYSVVQRVAVCCSILQYVAVCWDTHTHTHTHTHTPARLRSTCSLDLSRNRICTARPALYKNACEKCAKSKPSRGGHAGCESWSRCKFLTTQKCTWKIAIVLSQKFILVKWL